MKKQLLFLLLFLPPSYLPPEALILQYTWHQFFPIQCLSANAPHFSHPIVFWALCKALPTVTLTQWTTTIAHGSLPPSLTAVPTAPLIQTRPPQCCLMALINIDWYLVLDPEKSISTKQMWSWVFIDFLFMFLSIVQALYLACEALLLNKTGNGNHSVIMHKTFLILWLHVESSPFCSP